jgi:hypothetical protein
LYQGKWLETKTETIIYEKSVEFPRIARNKNLERVSLVVQFRSFDSGILANVSGLKYATSWVSVFGWVKILCAAIEKGGGGGGSGGGDEVRPWLSYAPPLDSREPLGYLGWSGKSLENTLLIA